MAVDKVKERGNKVVHYDPQYVKDGLGTIRAALQVIDGLSRLETPGH